MLRSSLAVTVGAVMKIGIKYCGGCNTTYNRSRQVERLKQQFPEHEFAAAVKDAEYDICLVVCGCNRACASADGLNAADQIFILPAERSFAAVREYLEERRTREQGQVTEVCNEKKTGILAGRKVLKIGQEAELTRTFFRDDAVKFASLTGDFNRLHLDPVFAEKTPYGRPVIHGVLAASLISSVMGTELPGEGTILVEEQIRFLKPVFYGDTITAKVRLVSFRELEGQYMGTFEGTCLNQNGETVIWASCRQLMDKQLFEIDNGGMPERTEKNRLESEEKNDKS